MFFIDIKANTADPLERKMLLENMELFSREIQRLAREKKTNIFYTVENLREHLNYYKLTLDPLEE